MSVPFFIVGLPRSGTAWLSAACNTVQGVICYHEPTGWVEKWQDVTGLLSQSRHTYAGASDHGLALHLPALLQGSSGRILVVRRSREACERSWRLAVGEVPGRLFDLLQKRIADVAGDIRVRQIEYSGLKDTAEVVAALSWLLPGSLISADKIAEMQRLNVQADMERMRRDWKNVTYDRVKALVGADNLALLEEA